MSFHHVPPRGGAQYCKLSSERHTGWVAPGAADMFKVEAFVRWERTKRFLLMSRHGRFRGRRDGDYVPLPPIGNHQDK